MMSVTVCQSLYNWLFSNCISLYHCKLNNPVMKANEFLYNRLPFYVSRNSIFIISWMRDHNPTGNRIYWTMTYNACRDFPHLQDESEPWCHLTRLKPHRPGPVQNLFNVDQMPRQVYNWSDHWQVISWPWRAILSPFRCYTVMFYRTTKRREYPYVFLFLFRVRV